MSDSTVLIIVDDIAKAYDFGASHPLRPERVLMTYDNIRSMGFLDDAKVVEVPSRSATDDEILAVHDPVFVNAVKDIDTGMAPTGLGRQFGLGTPDNPIFDDMHVAAAAVCGASVRAAELVVTGEAQHSFNPAGGLHHARRSEASGFCIYNDPAVAIGRILRLHPDWRVMYIDVDVHHGDGVQWIFYEEPRVLTLSLHQSGRYLYPGTGFEDEIGRGDAIGTSANIPLLPFTGNEDYLWALEETALGLAEAFRPDALVVQLGADTHFNDPLANLGLTMPAFPPMIEILHRCAHDFASGRLVATGGGGYQFETVVPKVWTMHFAEMCDMPQRIPHDWMDDKPADEVSKPYRNEVEASVRQVLGACVPRLRALAGSAP